MRCLVKQGEQWERENPADIFSWLCAHDGEQAVVIDDAAKPKRFFCATEELKAEYEASGKKAAMFYDLGLELHEKGKR